MRWDEDFDVKSSRAHRPSAEAESQGDGRFRHPVVQAEVERRVEVYRQQVEHQGRITWLPRRRRA